MTRITTKVFYLSLLSYLLPAVSIAHPAAPSGVAVPSSSVPTCAESCLASAKAAQTCTEDACYCKHASDIQNAITSCLASSSACTTTDTAAAVAFYPQYCASMGITPNVVAASNGVGGIVSASGQAPPLVTPTSGAGPSYIITATTTAEPTVDEVLGRDKTSVSAILGLTFGVAVIAVAVLTIAIYSCLRKRQLRNRNRRSRMDFFNEELGGPEPARAIVRPTRCDLVQSRFLVQPSPIEKDEKEFGGADLSRSSTLVSEPAPAARLDKDLPAIRASVQHVEDPSVNLSMPRERGSARRSAMKKLLGDHGKRPSLLSMRSKSSQSVKTMKSSEHGKGAAGPPETGAVREQEEHDDKGDAFDEQNKI